MSDPMRARGRRRWSVAIAGTIIVAALSYAFVVRPWSMRWGATDEEVMLALPGDGLIPAGASFSTCAVTVHAPASEVWAWLVQLGQGRGGFYSFEWLENLFAADMRNAGEIVPELQGLRVGDRLSFQRNGPSTAVTMLDSGRTLVLGAGWEFVLIPLDPVTTRFIVRYPYDSTSGIAEAAYYHAIFEPAHFVMEVGMMLGIRERAEGSFRDRGAARPSARRS